MKNSFIVPLLNRMACASFPTPKVWIGHSFSIIHTKCEITLLLGAFLLQFIDTLWNPETKTTESLQLLTLLWYP